MLKPRGIGNTTSGIRHDNPIKHDGIIIEFKVQDTEEKNLTDTVEDALRQIREKNYRANLITEGIPKDKIRKYGFAFCGKKVLIGRT